MGCDVKKMMLFDVQEAMKSGSYISGTTGTGKSDVAMYQADMLMNEGITVFTFDGTQDWMSRSSIPYYQTVDAKKPLDVTFNGDSTVFDISKLTIPHQKKLVEWFCKTIFEHQSEQLSKLRQHYPYESLDDLRERLPKYFVFFEEAHTYFPQGCMRAKAYENTVRLLTQGRNYNVRIGCITQFASLVDKNAIRYMKQRYFGYTDEPNDVDYIKGFIRQEAQKLTTLKAGQFIYKHRNNIEKIQIQPFKTPHRPQPKNLDVDEYEADKKVEETSVKPHQASDVAVAAFLLAILLIGLTLGWIISKLWR